jgi:hypothetical protein
VDARKHANADGNRRECWIGHVVVNADTVPSVPTIRIGSFIFC